ncbi:MAG: NUDIX hydrolase [Sphingomonadales bacterium]|jgi:ADP-ribose pyrophosphatase YjhB (NUDIX family)
MSDRSYPHRPHVAVGVVVLAQDHVLLIQRGKPPRQGQWSIPGGAQHAGERLTDTALREVREETGLDVELGGLIDALDYIDHDAQGAVHHHYTLIDYWANGQLDQVPQAAEDAAQAKWVALRDLDKLEMWEETVRIIRTAVELAK